MTDYERALAHTAAQRRRRDQADDRLHTARRRLATATADLERARRTADRQRAVEAERLIRELSVEIERENRSLTERNRDLAISLDGIRDLGAPRALIEQWDDRTPILLLPVRVETRFMPVAAPTELWVRLFPDDIAVHSHEPALSATEVEAGGRYWTEVAAAASVPDTERRSRTAAAWQALAGDDPRRAAWIVRQTKPELTAGEVASGQDFWDAFNASPSSDDTRGAAWQALADWHGPSRARRIALQTAPNDQAAAAVDRLAAETPGETWGRAPRSRVMPDCFSVVLQAAGRPDRTVTGRQIPDPLLVGPDPSRASVDIDRVDGEIRLSDDLRWMHDFDAAERTGMALRVPLSAEEVSGGFDRLLVIGLRCSSDEDQSRRLVEQLFDGHHYSPGGAGLVPQGTPTNNTAMGPSGFDSTILRGGDDEDLETGPALFVAADEVAERTDGQWLAEALGIEYAPLQHLRHADRGDVRHARLMNQALWPATLGYYLEQMLGLDVSRVRDLERFCVEYVSGRGPLPAIRVGTQPYAVLLTSDVRQWQPSPLGVTAATQLVHDVTNRLDPIWEQSANLVSFVGKAGDAYAHLLNMLGLHATSVDYFRRHAFGSAFLWNYAGFLGWGAAAGDIHNAQAQAARQLLSALGWPAMAAPPIVNLTFSSRHSAITDPLVDDIAVNEEERWSETEGVVRRYRLGTAAGMHNYLAWLHASTLETIKAQTFESGAGEPMPVPRPLLYRLMRQALLLAHVDAALQLYQAHGVVSEAARREEELPNVRGERSVTRWELLEARVDRVLPQVSDRPVAMAEYLRGDDGQRRPEASSLRRVVAALKGLVDLPTAALERLLAEHVDLCSYRLDAWQTALFTERLRALRDPTGTSRIADRVLGLHLGAFGWLEDVRRGAAPALVDPERVPPSLRATDDAVTVEQADSGGVIHGPSPAHAVAAAILRNAYLTHASPSAPTIMSVELPSSRVRQAMRYLEGIGAGQSLGALLGYQFQRGLRERHGDPSLAQFILNFRDAYPVRADKLTPDSGGDPAALKESTSVFDGYALLERTLLAEPPVDYPYGVTGLPDAASSAAAAIRNEIDRMAAAMDAVADLALAEGVFQVAQGNFDRAGAMMQAISRGLQPPEPEIPRTPRSGIAITHRVAVHLDPGAAPQQWTATPTARSTAEPALNAWLAERLGSPSTIRFVVRRGPTLTEDASNSIADLGLEAIDLIHIVGDDLPERESELVRRIRHAYRLRNGGTEDAAVQVVEVDFPAAHAGWQPGDRSFFETLPLLTALKRLVLSARPLGAADYVLPSEEHPDPDTDDNPQRYDVEDSNTRLTAVLAGFSAAQLTLAQAIASATALDPAVATPSQRATALGALIEATSAFAQFGLPDAFAERRAVPAHAGDRPTPYERVLAHHLDRAAGIQRQAEVRRAEAVRLKDFTDLDAQAIAALTAADKIERHRDAARQLLGADFNLLPRFAFKNVAELTAATAFRERPLSDGLLRHSGNPMAVEEWFQGAACVRERLDTLETVMTLGDALATPAPMLRPLQLPFRASDLWMAVEYPEPPAFSPVGEFLSIVQQLPSGGFDPAATQVGLLLDAWTEVIPNRIETSGMAVHYNQPGAQPPQALLLAVTPRLTGAWTWDRLVGVLTDTLRRARQRAVEPDHLGATALGHLLPAVMTPVASRPDATVSADLVHATAVAFANPGVDPA